MHGTSPSGMLLDLTYKAHYKTDIASGYIPSCAAHDLQEAADSRSTLSEADIFEPGLIPATAHR